MDYLLIDDARLMVVTSDVRSFGDENTAEAAFDALYEAIGECTHFEDTSEDGLESTVIDVTIDTDTATEDVDDQFDMTGGGTWTFDGQEIPLGVGFSIARIDSNVTMVMLLSIGVPEDSELLAPYTEIAADRLAAVTAGETPEDVAAPQPVAAPPVRVPIERRARDARGVLRLRAGGPRRRLTGSDLDDLQTRVDAAQVVGVRRDDVEPVQRGIKSDVDVHHVRLAGATAELADGAVTR